MRKKRIASAYWLFTSKYCRINGVSVAVGMNVLIKHAQARAVKRKKKSTRKRLRRTGRMIKLFPSGP